MKLHVVATFICMGAAFSSAAWADHGQSVSSDVAVTAPVLGLAEAMQAARAHQPTLNLARGNQTSAAGQVEQARSALLPQLSGVASFARGTNNYVPSPGGANPNGSLTPSSSFTTYSKWGAQLSANQLIWDFGESLNKWKAARVGADAVAENVHVTEAQIDYNTRVAFFTARAAKDMVAVARETLANQERHLRQVKGFVDVGTHPEIDLSQARADRASAELQLINSEGTFAVARATLVQAMGIERSIDYDLSDEDFPPVENEDGKVESLVDEAKSNRPEMVNLRLTMQSQELNLRATRDMIWPNLNVSGSLSDSGPALDRTVWNFSGLISLSVPIIQGGAINAQIRQAEGQLVQAKAQADTQGLQVRLDVEQARLGIRGAKAAIASAEDAFVNSRDRLRLAEGRYQAGAGNIIELGDAQLALTTAAAQKVQAQYQLYTARAQLLKALGRRD
jgi:outer membrane protein